MGILHTAVFFAALAAVAVIAFCLLKGLGVEDEE